MRLIAFLALTGFLSGLADADEQAIQLFDGKTLDGWNGDEKWFRVEEGVIIAEVRPNVSPQTSFFAPMKAIPTLNCRSRQNWSGRATMPASNFEPSEFQTTPR